MEFNQVDRSNWKSFFDFVSKQTRSLDMEIWIASLEIGDQMEADWVRSEGFSYEPRTDNLCLHTAAMDHNIQSPKTIVIGGYGPVIRSISITDAADRLQLIRFREPLQIGAI